MLATCLHDARKQLGRRVRLTRNLKLCRSTVTRIRAVRKWTNGIAVNNNLLAVGIEVVDRRYDIASYVQVEGAESAVVRGG